MTKLTIGQLARRTRLNVETLRYYERRGLLPAPARKASGYRQYDALDVARVDTELTALANRKNIMTSTTETGEQDAVRARLSHLSGAEFDAAYLDQMVKDHQQAVADFTAAEKSSDTDVRAFAAKTLPLLRDHLRRSENHQKVTGKGK